MFCDFTIAHHFQIALLLAPDIFDAYPDIQAFVQAIGELPGVHEYLATRPQLTGVGTAPVLVHGGVIIQPGFA